MLCTRSAGVRGKGASAVATTILLADDHPMVRLGLRAALQTEPEFRVVGETGDGQEVLSLVQRLCPNVLVLDLVMPGIRGLDILRNIQRRAPCTRVVVLTVYADEAYVATALKGGAIGYVVKGSPAAEVIKAVREGSQGRCYLSAPLSEASLKRYLRKAEGSMLDPYETLTTREREVLHLVAEGHTSAVIAARLYISTRTVESHRANLMGKLGLHSPTELVRYALRRGILAPDV
ncbi:MAG: response regulator [Candidatus Binatia bacterium]